MYDPQYRDYHNWNDQEDRYYRQWLADRNREYVAYDQLDRRDQREYWKWRHKQEKRDRKKNMKSTSMSTRSDKFRVR